MVLLDLESGKKSIAAQLTRPWIGPSILIPSLIFFENLISSSMSTP